MAEREDKTREIQRCLLDILKAIDKVCEEHGLTYYMIAGTLLGAVRHKGFIPWDDDADIALPRKDYEKLIRHADEWLPSQYRVVDYKTDKKYPYPFARIQDVRTTYRPYRDFGYIGGVPVDIFPLDGMVEKGVKRWWHYLKYRTCIKLLYLVTVNPQKHGNGIRYYFLSAIRKIWTPQWNFEKIEYLQKEYDFDAYTLVADHDNKADRGILPKEVYGKPVRYRFEDTELNGVADADAYLRYCYGDYMTPPKRQPRLNYRELDLEKSFLKDISL